MLDTDPFVRSWEFENIKLSEKTKSKIEKNTESFPEAELKNNLSAYWPDVDKAIKDSLVDLSITTIQSLCNGQDMNIDQVMKLVDILGYKNDVYAPCFVHNYVLWFAQKSNLTVEQISSLILCIQWKEISSEHSYQKFFIQINALWNILSDKTIFLNEKILNYTELLTIAELFDERNADEIQDFAQCIVDYGPGFLDFISKNRDSLHTEWIFLVLTKYKSYNNKVTIENIQNLLDSNKDIYQVKENLKSLWLPLQELNVFNTRKRVKLWRLTNEHIERIWKTQSNIIKAWKKDISMVESVHGFGRMGVSERIMLTDDQRETYFPSLNDIQQYINMPYHDIDQWMSWFCYMYSMEALLFGEWAEDISVYYTGYCLYLDQLQTMIDDLQKNWSTEHNFADWWSGDDYIRLVKKYGILPKDVYDIQCPVIKEFDGYSRDCIEKIDSIYQDIILWKKEKSELLRIYPAIQFSASNDISFADKVSALVYAKELLWKTFGDVPDNFTFKWTTYTSNKDKTAAQLFAEANEIEKKWNIISVVNRMDQPWRREYPVPPWQEKNAQQGELFHKHDGEKREFFSYVSNETMSLDGKASAKNLFNIPREDLLSSIDYTLSQWKNVEIGIDTDEPGIFFDRPLWYRIYMLTDESTYETQTDLDKEAMRKEWFEKRKTTANHSVFIQWKVEKEWKIRYVCYDPAFSALQWHQWVTLLSKNFIEQKNCGVTLPKEILKEYFIHEKNTDISKQIENH